MKLEFCITLPALKMLNPILSSNRVPRVLEYLKTVKNSNLQKLYRNNLTNLHGTVSLISTNNLELLDHLLNNFLLIYSSIGECNIQATRYHKI